MAVINSLGVNNVKAASCELTLDIGACFHRDMAKTRKVPRSEPHHIETELEAIGRRLLWFRKALGISQVKLCKRTGIATNTYNQWEKGKRRPDVDEAKKLFEVGCTLDWIYAERRVGIPGHILDQLPPPVAKAA